MMLEAFVIYKEFRFNGRTICPLFHNNEIGLREAGSGVWPDCQYSHTEVVAVKSGKVFFELN